MYTDIFCAHINIGQGNLNDTRLKEILVNCVLPTRNKHCCQGIALDWDTVSFKCKMTTEES